MRELSFVKADDPPVKRFVMGLIEDVLGRRKYLPLYREWRRDIYPHSTHMLCDLLDFIDVRLDIHSAAPWPVTPAPDLPLVLVANHPFGLADGIVLCALAEQLQRPYKVILNKDLLSIDEIRPHALPIDFSDAREAIKANVKTRAEARQALKDGTTIVIFPAGGVATAANPFGAAEDLPWKTFVASLVQSTRASVLPVFFEGQNSALFHLASRISLRLRLSSLISEFSKFPGQPCRVHIGPITAFELLQSAANREALTNEIYRLVFQLAPQARERDPSLIQPRPSAARPNFPGLD